MKNALTLLGVTLTVLAPCAHAQFGGGPTKIETIEVRDDIMAALKAVTNQPVKYVINTHYHADHSGGNAKLQAGGSLVFASDQARARMIAIDQAGLPNITVADAATIRIGGQTVEIHKIGRAHTNTDLVVLFPEQRLLAAGDIFANGPGTSAQLVDYAGGGSAKGVARGRRSSAQARVRRGDSGSWADFDPRRSRGRRARAVRLGGFPRAIGARRAHRGVSLKRSPAGHLR